MRLLCRKYNFLENSKNRILVKKFFLAKQKNTCLFIVDKEPKKIISFKSAISTVNLIWNDPYAFLILNIENKKFQFLTKICEMQNKIFYSLRYFDIGSDSFYFYIQIINGRYIKIPQKVRQTFRPHMEALFSAIN